jgi:hypothetical protein
LGLDDEGTGLARTAVASAVSRTPFVQVAAPREGDGVTAGVGISTRAAGAKTGVRSYLQGK